MAQLWKSSRWLRLYDWDWETAPWPDVEHKMAEYRARIHADLTERLADLDRAPVIIVAHSLGSVIAVDSLLAHPEAWSRFPRLRLLTCGSPLRNHSSCCF